MTALDVNGLFARAERSFAAGRLDAARADLMQVRLVAGDQPALLHLLGLVEKRRGDLAAARAAFEGALRAAPRDPQINNNLANLLAALGEEQAALTHYDRALAATPNFADARYNRALLLQRAGRAAEALAELDRLPASGKLHSARGGVLRELGRLHDAAAAYDASLALQPDRLVALHGRARVAMERGEPGASNFYRRALAVEPGNPELQLGLAEALEAGGEPGAADCLADFVARDPGWVEGQAALARIRWEAGEGAAFARGFEAALRDAPRDRNLWLAYVAALAQAELHGRACDAAAQGRALAGDDGRMMLLEAVHAGEAGDAERAARLFRQLPSTAEGRDIHYLRHLLRTGAWSEAAELADGVRAANGGDVGIWAMTGLVWRLLGDERAIWLHEQPGVVDTRELGLSGGDIAAIADRLRGLHRTRAHPIGQSLRGGTQTRGRLFARAEPEIARLREAISDALESYWTALPAADPAHPLLRHRAGTPRLDGSWSVRLTDGGFHVAHVHPHGVLSSACYLILPDAPAPEGWLEIGGPPASLGLPLPPLRMIEPRPGRLALFPSTLYHGTRPFSAGERLTAAFDVIAA